jgi:hypothetical protein
MPVVVVVVVVVAAATVVEVMVDSFGVELKTFFFCYV